jgi:threonine aldolase
MRQAGIVAAGCVHALDHHVDRLGDDHDNAKRLAQGLAEMPGIGLDPSLIETNIVFFDLSHAGPSAPALAARLAERGVRIGAMGERRMRAVTHLDIDEAAIDKALDLMATCLRM